MGRRNDTVVPPHPAVPSAKPPARAASPTRGEAEGCRRDVCATKRQTGRLRYGLASAAGGEGGLLHSAKVLPWLEPGGGEATIDVDTGAGQETARLRSYHQK